MAGESVRERDNRETADKQRKRQRDNETKEKTKQGDKGEKAENHMSITVNWTKNFWLSCPTQLLTLW